MQSVMHVYFIVHFHFFYWSLYVHICTPYIDLEVINWCIGRTCQTEAKKQTRISQNDSLSAPLFKFLLSCEETEIMHIT